ncbi:MAG: GntR family transcriptional regulator [Rubrivivax sp.]|jgi:DNA-binding GntR family transcriptional regulator|nr:GntR family transcriptional regulator [Rubrivivax sp.]
MLTDPPNANPPSQRTATERVYGNIYRAMIEHRLQPGAWLREEELAETFGVSRTVVRQALQRLAQDHLIELQHNRGARVAQPSLREAEHVFEARRVVECEVARRLGGSLDPEQLDALRRLVMAEAEADARGDHGAAVRISGEFHQALARMHGNPLFCRWLDGLLPTTSLLMVSFKTSGGPVCVAHRHAELLDALAHSSAAAAAEMRRHLKELERALTTDAARQPALRDVFAPYREAPDDHG